jgi:hypothetical protein
MQIILSILLYLNIISSPGTYTMTEIKTDVIVNQVQVQAVQADAKLLSNVIATYKSKVLGITVLDDGQLK